MSTLSFLFERRTWPLLVLVALLTISLLLPPGVAAQGTTISGRVVDPDGLLPPAGTVVRLLRADRSTFGKANVDPADGSFSLGGVPNGNYILRAVPPEPSAFTPSQPLPVSVLGVPLDVGTLDLTRPSIVGTVYAPDGLTPASAWLHVDSAGQWREVVPATGGAIKVGGLPVGTYALRAWPMDDEPYWASQRISVTVTGGVSQTISLTLTTADVYGRAVDAVGNPVKEAVARVVNQHGRVVARDLTSGSGFFALGGLAPGSYRLLLEPPWWLGGLVPPQPVPFTIPPQQNLGVIAFRASSKVVTGKVETNVGQPVVGARIDAHRLDKHGRVQALSGSGGRYAISLSEGLWSLTVEPISTTVPARWLYPYGPQLVHFQHDTSNEQRTVNFEVLTADSNVLGTVLMPDGSVPTFTVTVGIHTDGGVGPRQTIDPADGSFDIAVPHGPYQVSVLAADPGYMGPAVAPIRVPPNSMLDLGTLSLLERNALITGTVSSAEGEPVGDIPILAWRPDAPGWAHARSGPDGGYVLPVVRGDWLVRVAPLPDQPWLYSGQAQEVAVPDGGLVPDVDFRLLAAEAQVQGVLVDEGGTPLSDARGWVQATEVSDPAVHKGAPVAEGAFHLLLPDGTYRLSLKLPEGAPWLPGPAQEVTASSGLTATVTLTLRARDAAIAGALWDHRQEKVVTGVQANVSAFSEGTWVRTAVKPGNGAYSLDVAAGVWALGYRVDPASDYVALRHRRNYPVAAGQTVPAPLPVAERDGAIAGVVRDPSGAPLGGATVVADGVGPQLGDLALSVVSGPDGRFHLELPHGHYLVRAGGEPGENWLQPLSRDVNVPPGGSVTGLELQFLQPDATLSGTVTLAGGGVHSGTVKVWAYSLDDGFAHSQAELGGNYSLEVISNTVWHVGAAYQEGNQYWLARARVDVPPGGATEDLVLRGPFPLPGPVTVSFDASQEQYLELADGTSIFIPAGAMPVSGTVTLHVTPIATFPNQRHANVYRYGYAFTAADANGQPIESRFNQDVLIIFPYDEEELVRMGLSEWWLKPAYYSTSTDSWTFPQSYVVDMTHNVVAMEIDHFTDFALTAAAGLRVYLPLIQR